MQQLDIELDEELLEKACAYAAARGTTVQALVTAFLQTFTDGGVSNSSEPAS